MKWKVMKDNDRYLICQKTWHSSAWMGIVKKDIRKILIHDRLCAVEVYADCSTSELAHKLLALKLKA